MQYTLMIIESIKHKALRKFAVTGKPAKLMEAERLGDMLAFILAAPNLEALKTPPNYGFHPLTGNRKGEYAMTVTRNWRLVFSLNDEGAIVDMDLEDYH